MRKKVAIVGGGISGLTAGYLLSKAGYEIFIFEKEKKLGGLASGFEKGHWKWELEKTVHHIFSNDTDILDFSKEIGYKEFIFKKPITCSLYFKEKPRFYALDTPFNFLSFPLLSFLEKLRSAVVLGFLRFSPFFSFYEKNTALTFLEKTMSKKATDILWRPLFRKKFGKYAGKILFSFFWARIKKRTKKLGYPKGGFQSFINFLEDKAKKERVRILKGKEVVGVEKNSKNFVLYTREGKFEFNKIIFALQLPIVLKIARKVLPERFVNEMEKIEYLHAVSLVVETDEPIVKDFYWINVADESLPFMGIFQHTNFINKKNYGNSHIAYIGWYCKKDDFVFKAEKEEILKFVLPHLRRIGFKGKIKNFFLFKAPFAQPIFDRYFVEHKPSFIFPTKGFYFAGFELSYPYDRGTNYAVKVGKEVSRIVIKNK